MYGVTGYKFQWEQDMTSSVCVYVAGKQYIQVLSMATGRSSHGLPLSSSLGHWLLRSVLFCGMGGRGERLTFAYSAPCHQATSFQQRRHYLLLPPTD